MAAHPTWARHAEPPPHSGFRPRAAAVRMPLRRPHLVNTTEIRLQAEAVVDGGIEADAVGETARGGLSFSDSSPRTSVARVAAPTRGAAAKRIVDVLGAIVLGLV